MEGMENVHHKPIKKFSISGNIHDDSALVRLRTEYYNLLKSEMVLSGYVPRLDIEQDFTIEYNQENQYFEFELSMYGVFVGKRRSEWITGIDGTTVIYTHQSRLAECSQEQV
jgi:hypothetical protein